MSDLRVSFPQPCSERWEDMRAVGCNRHCDSCDKVIHDLSQMTIEETDALFQADPEPCVRAKIVAGIVSLKNGSSSGRRLVTAFGTTVSLAVAGCQSPPGEYPAYGNVAGKVNNDCWAGVVTATAEDGRVFSAKVGRDRRFILRYLPHGKYQISYLDVPGEPASGGSVTITGGTIVLPAIDPKEDCITVGVMSLDPAHKG